jgi:predicted TIM-barrel fold metal-dependent hydrolase
MAYVEDRFIHDADSHIMELPGFLDDYVEARFKSAINADASYFGRRPNFLAQVPEILRRQSDPAWRDEDGAQIMQRKDWDATGAFRREDRPKALDHLGFKSQLVISTAYLIMLTTLEHGDDVDLAYAAAAAHNRHVVDFCAIDRRLLAVGYVPLMDLARAVAAARQAIALGCKALMIPSQCPETHAVSHIGLDPLWAMAQEAGLPIVFHVGGGGPPVSLANLVNGLPPVPDFHGGDLNFTSISYMAAGTSVMQALGTLIIDRVLDRFPRLRVGVIEQGASWLPGWMRTMDSAFTAFYKNEERLKAMSMKPSDFVHRQVRVTPYSHEDTGWIIANSGEEICLFSSDYPHVEGGRNPLKRFEQSLAATPPAVKRRFYSDNFVDLMGEGLAADLRYPVVSAA